MINPGPKIDPVDVTDDFCTCPACGLLGTHLLEVKTWVSNDDPPTFMGNPTAPWSIWATWPEGTVYAIRQCRSCERMWHTCDDERD